MQINRIGGYQPINIQPNLGNTSKGYMSCVNLKNGADSISFGNTQVFVEKSTCKYILRGVKGLLDTRNTLFHSANLLCKDNDVELDSRTFRFALQNIRLNKECKGGKVVIFEDDYDPIYGELDDIKNFKECSLLVKPAHNQGYYEFNLSKSLDRDDLEVVFAKYKELDERSRVKNTNICDKSVINNSEIVDIITSCFA